MLQSLTIRSWITHTDSNGKKSSLVNGLCARNFWLGTHWVVLISRTPPKRFCSMPVVSNNVVVQVGKAASFERHFQVWFLLWGRLGSNGNGQSKEESSYRGCRGYHDCILINGVIWKGEWYMNSDIRAYVSLPVTTKKSSCFKVNVKTKQIQNKLYFKL